MFSFCRFRSLKRRVFRFQVQLEKIRQSEKELRWQYEEDVDNCGECRQPFNVTKRKVRAILAR